MRIAKDEKADYSDVASQLKIPLNPFSANSLPENGAIAYDINSVTLYVGDGIIWNPVGGGGGGPTGPAGGDLGQNYPDPTVVGFQGRVVSATAPVDKNVYTWDSGTSEWNPAMPGTKQTIARNNINQLVSVNNSIAANERGTILVTGTEGLGLTTVDFTMTPNVQSSPVSVTYGPTAFENSVGSAQIFNITMMATSSPSGSVSIMSLLCTINADGSGSLAGIAPPGSGGISYVGQITRIINL
jgi:hypothetical protein